MRSVGDCHLEGTVLTAIFVDLESNLSRKFVLQGPALVLSSPVALNREACHADPNRAGPLFPCAPIAGSVFAYREHVVGRSGCTRARLVGKVKDHSD